MNNRVEQHAVSCVGCMGCANVCPTRAIQMQYDDNGFLYPIVDDTKCLNCSKCKSVCQMYQSRPVEEYFQCGYIAISQHKKIYQNAASGGVFGAIAMSFFDNYPSACVIGAAFLNGKVSHVSIKSKSEIEKLQNSKYVQSEMGEIYKDIKSALDDGREVLFSGTPCQVYALNLFLNKQYDKLFTIDLICHGVPSPLFLKRDLQQYGDDIENIKFRFKKRHLKSRSGFIMSVYQNGRCKNVLSNRDPYYSLFVKNMSFRESCYECRFANLQRVGDVTVGDCDSHKLYPKFHAKEATSTVIINSRKGESLWTNAGHMFDYLPLSLEKEAEMNTQLMRPSKKPEGWGDLMKETQKKSIEALKKKYSKPEDIKGKVLLIINRYL